MQQKFREFEKGELTKIRLILHLTLAFLFNLLQHLVILA